MCQYSAVDGLPDDWHLVHLGARAVGGAGLVLTEASAVSPEGRISPQDAGIWNDEQAQRWARIVRFVQQQGAAAGVQLAHAGRKASSHRPWGGRGYVQPADGGWESVGASPIGFDTLPAPRELDEAGLAKVRADFVAAARRADEAGFDVVELHAAHGYLLHTFLAPLSNTRTDGYGGDLAARMRFPLEVVEAVRDAWPQDKPLLLRISASDWADGGWTLDDSVLLAKEAAARGVDLVDCSSGGLVPNAKIELGPGYQVPFAAAVRRAGVPSGAVGLLTEPEQADKVVRDGDADVVLLARELLRDPHWPLRAAAALGVEAPWPDQYVRARPA
jgi:2,4-dienoyl-CoA reductase-like NADH-dependent reductase (Old Yellow Enzyme family)